MTFVKSAETDVTVARSQAELERILRRYGAAAFGIETDYVGGTSTITFRIPDHPGGPANVPVRLIVDRDLIYGRLFGPTKPADQAPGKRAQAERVAWRHLVLWVDAACTAAGSGLQTVSEAFLAHVLIRGTDGGDVRVVDHLGTLAPGGNWVALLPARSGGGP